jgi:dTDP-4-amino-4,6-dideoxygalactose transaminase
MTIPSVKRIPFNRATLSGREFEYIQQAIDAAHLSGDGAFTKKCQALLERYTGSPKALLTTSCTHALEMAALLLDIQPGDEVICPSFTFVSSVNAFVLRGARPVFADVRPDTLNIDEAQLERHVSPRTRAIVVVHYAGVACEMDAIQRIAAAHDLAIVEDNAHGLFGSYRGRPLGSFGALATLSFHETKNVTCGEGGALLINDQAFVDRAEIVREKGTNRSRFFRGEVDKYSWVDIGSSYLPSELLAAFLLAQLEHAAEIQKKRRHVWETYREGLESWAVERNARLPIVPPHCDQAYHLFYMLMPDLDARERLRHHLAAEDVNGVFHYLPLHASEMGRRFGGAPGDCPVTERISDRLLRLPFHNGLSDDDLQRVLEAVRRSPRG